MCGEGDFEKWTARESYLLQRSLAEEQRKAIVVDVIPSDCNIKNKEHEKKKKNLQRIY